jgi:signal transduction histidine kinase
MSSLLRDVEALELSGAEQIGKDEAYRLVQDERLRLARELHDIVSFGFATIAMQAGVAAHVADSRPEQALEALQTIRTASRDVLSDIRALLGQLREDDEAAEPARGIGQLSALADSAGRAGLRASVLVLGRPRPVLLSVDFCVYRVVQEALANAIRHAAGATVSVKLVYEQRRLVVTIEDDGRSDATAVAAEGSGYGLVGMRERVQAVGGELDAASLPGRGFRVCATVPFPARP